MVIQSLVIISAVFFSNLSMAYEAVVKVYTFENKGTNSSKNIKLEDKNTPLPVQLPWFDWKCSAQKQVDGVVVYCERGSEIAETKIYCYVNSPKEARYIRLTKGENFVSLETQCRLTKEEIRKINLAKKRRLQRTKKNIPPKERIPVPQEENQELRVYVPKESTVPPSQEQGQMPQFQQPPQSQPQPQVPPASGGPELNLPPPETMPPPSTPPGPPQQPPAQQIPPPGQIPQQPPAPAPGGPEMNLPPPDTSFPTPPTL